ncbi:MAG: AAA family ATPase, partial [Gordonia sp. (in: high G+C Gram-positive bacteria)]|uniref:McrB family protein n=1 Tax=Gordonia sp. (in: high G+C Gram-positive bacteria) TaxID=84139 RepID=UPI003BB6CC16
RTVSQALKLLAGQGVIRETAPKEWEMSNAERLFGIIDVIEDCVDEEYSGTVGEVIRLLSTKKNVLVEGVAGSGKSYLLGALAKYYNNCLEEGAPSRVEFIVFHPASTYEDFVRGLRIDGDRNFAIQDGVFVEVCKRAWAEYPTPHLLFIDEINRAPTARVLGDLLFAIEAGKRVAVDNHPGDGPVGADWTESSIRLLMSDDKHGPYLVVPDNLHILGTMNSTDRSVGSLDLALQRRFHRKHMSPMSGDDLRDAILSTLAPAEIEAGDSRIVDELVSWFDELNSRLRAEIGPDAEVGHSYFFANELFDRETGGCSADGISWVQYDILKQTAEVFRIFAVDSDTISRVFDLPIEYPGGEWEIVLLGQGLGATPVVQRVDSEVVGEVVDETEPDPLHGASDEKIDPSDIDVNISDVATS